MPNRHPRVIEIEGRRMAYERDAHVGNAHSHDAYGHGHAPGFFTRWLCSTNH
jgi:hypothetical protein